MIEFFGAVVGTGFFLIPFALVGLLIWWSVKRNRERSQRIAAFAASRGWHYRPNDPSLIRRFTAKPFGRGSSRRTGDVIYGTYRDRDAVAFRYSYETGSGDNETTHTFTVVAMKLGDVVMPNLSVTPESSFGRFFGRVFDYDIELESADFNDAFTVTSSDRKFAFDVLHPHMMEGLMHHRYLSWRIDRDSLLVITQDSGVTDGLDQKLELMSWICAQIPDFVWQATRVGGQE